TKKLLRLYEKIPVIKREKIMILGESIHTISNCLIKLGIKSETARMVAATSSGISDDVVSTAVINLEAITSVSRSAECC
ncbi:hypothetical protein NL518_28820, partial [Klebsiella pneumoniae]|nr:hypothetical protein [Klebsiella pneumoniae]